MNNICRVYCTAPDTSCPYWIGISCEYEDAFYEEFKDIIDYCSDLKEKTYEL